MEVSRENMKQRLQEEITPLDVVAGVIYFFGKDASFPTDYKSLHKAFFSEKDNALFKEFKFKETGPYPYSELLESVFSRIAISGLLGCKNPDYRSYTVTSGQIRKIKSSSLGKFSKPQLLQLKCISQRIKSNLK